jgi:subtilisin family serine protease
MSLSTRLIRIVAGLAAVAVPALVGQRALAEPRTTSAPNGPELVRLLGSHALTALTARGSPGMGALVRLPPRMQANDVGLREIAPGIARLRGSPESIVVFATAHPDLDIEVAPPLHLLLDTAAGYVSATAAIANGLDGSGAIVGIADTGLDLTHPDFLDARGHTRVAWLLDLSSKPRGVYADLERTFGLTDASGNARGAVWKGDEIDAAIASGSVATLPLDEVGHGTLVTSCAAGGGAGGKSPFRGIAPAATIVLARISGSGADAIDNDGLLQGVAFLFDRADALGMPIVVNLSIGSDFGPHDGTTAWEQTLASHVGPAHPGHALVAAVGNSGSIAENPVHENVHVNPSTTTRVPIRTDSASFPRYGPTQTGAVDVWIAMHAGANLHVGLDAPGGTWILPLPSGKSSGKSTGNAGYDASVVNGSQPGESPSDQTHGAVVAWSGTWPNGTYFITLSGSGTADLYLQGSGEATNAAFVYGVREGTVGLPATHPSIIGVGCTINKKAWRSIDQVHVGLAVPLLDAVGGAPSKAEFPWRDPTEGEPCWFSSAGPTITGQQKPEIMAPGAAIVGALSQQAIPPGTSSIFTAPDCPAGAGGTMDPKCEQVDTLHGVSAGTSFSSPLVAGAVAVLFQRNPKLTQDEILAALQGGAHRLRGAAPFEDQSGVGELDVLGAVAAADLLQSPQVSWPTRTESWLTLGADQYLADGSTDLQAVVELRAARTDAAAPLPADGPFDARLAAYTLVDGKEFAPAPSLARRGPGVWIATVRLPPGLGGSSLTVGAKFDGADIVDRKSIPIATDAWNAEYPPIARGGCSVTSIGVRSGPGVLPLPESPRSELPGFITLVSVAALWRRRRARCSVVP